METPPPALRRRNSIDISAIPMKLHLHKKPKSSSFPQSTPTTVDYELVSLKSESPSSSYTSLKDLLPPTFSAVSSPTGGATAAATSSSISIRNRLVKQAAWAYLQPMSTSPVSSSRHFFRRMWNRFTGDPISAVIGFFHRHVVPTVSHAFDRLLRAFRVRTFR